MTVELVIYRTRSLLRSERWRWRLVANGRIVAESGEGYTDRAEAERMGNRVARGHYSPEV